MHARAGQHGVSSMFSTPDATIAHGTASSPDVQHFPSQLRLPSPMCCRLLLLQCLTLSGSSVSRRLLEPQPRPMPLQLGQGAGTRLQPCR